MMINLKRMAIALACSLISWLPSQVSVAGTISQVPLFIGGAVEPNVMFTLDDSGSMQWEFMPDENMVYSIFFFPRPSQLYGPGDYANQVPSFNDNSLQNFFGRCASNNRVFYDPNVTYTPWANADGSAMDDADPTAAYYNPYDHSRGTIDLTAQQTQSAIWFENTATQDLFDLTAAYFGTHTFWPITYYVYDGVGNRMLRASYRRVQITSATAADATFTSPDGSITRTRDEEIQNFANWFQYYRSRILLARAGVGQAFSRQGNSLRVGFASINKGSDTIDGAASDGTIINGVRGFEGADRDAFFALLYGHTIGTASTPLRSAIDNVGKYFKRADNAGPWGDNPGTNVSGDHLSCRQSYNILMTDGYWNGNNLTTPGIGGVNVDNINGPSISDAAGNTVHYVPEGPYADAFSNTLADVAMYYWNHDLRSDLDNRVRTNASDPAFWQHLVNFTVGLGVTGTLDPAADLPDLTDGTKSWPQPDGGETNIDDLWHAAVNSRGGFFSAANPVQFADALEESLRNIVGRIGSSSTIATNSTRLDNNTFIYQAKFGSEDWSGQLQAFIVDPGTGLPIDADEGTPDVVDPEWEASAELASRIAPRKIFTLDSSDANGDGIPGLPFIWASLPAGHQALLNMGPGGVDTEGENRVDYLRGDHSNEQSNSGGIFRNRSFILGDIVNSDPWFVGQQDLGYNLLPGAEGSSYLTYRSSESYQNRVGVIYVGANDGMLHAFEATTGEELFAYVPEAVLPDLWHLTDPEYTHRYFVDGPPNGKDAYVEVNGVRSWKSVLVGSLGAGGKAIYALDVTDPANFSANDVMWEFGVGDDDGEDTNGDGIPDGNGAPDGDLGYVLGQVSVVRMANGDWAAIFGNGYGSTNRSAVLFIVDISTGELIRKIDTQAVGDALHPNGLSTPIAVDINGDRIVDRVYAGDLLGNMWAFDLSSANDPSAWDVDYHGPGGVPQPLFVARDADGNVQSITGKPQETRHIRGGALVFFGTGKFFEIGDNIEQRKNAFYAIWDDFSASTPSPVSNARVNGEITALLKQAITHESVTTTNLVDGVQVETRMISDAAGNLTENPFDDDARATTDHRIDWDTHKGWYLELESPVNGWEGERVVSTPLLRENRVIFSTMIANPNPCESGGASWLMELDMYSGARLPSTPFDLNGDGVFDEQDYIEIATGEVNEAGEPITIKVPASGKKSRVGIIKTPSIVKGDAGREYKYTSGSSGEMERVVESRGYRVGRQSWRQLQ